MWHSTLIIEGRCKQKRLECDAHGAGVLLAVHLLALADHDDFPVPRVIYIRTAAG